MDNILFIGNGFDLHNGMKTSYTNYLDSLKIPEDYINNINKLIQIHRGFNILSSVEIEFKKSNSMYSSKSSDINIIFFDLTKHRQFNIKTNEYYHYINDISDNYHKLKQSNNNNKIYFRDFDGMNKFSILFLLSHALNVENQCFLNSIVNFEGELFEKIFKKRDYFDFELVKSLNYIDIIIDISLYKRYDYFSLYLELIRKYPECTSNNLIANINELAAGEDWIDLENILYYNQFPHFQSNISNNEDKFEYTTETLFMYRNFIKIFDTAIGADTDSDTHTDFDTDFESFKYKFSEYVKQQQEEHIDKPSVSKLLTKINKDFKLNKVYNFNYSNYITDIFRGISDSILIDNIHGSVNDGKNIVFGSNHYLFLNDLTHYNELLRNHNKQEYISQKESDYKLTKFYQVLKLSQTRETSNLENVNSLTVLGHSIGKQDFEYFHTIINSNPNEIRLNIIWSTFKNKKGEWVNNLESLTNAVYEMLESYKDLYQDITVHRMILENRIKFIHLDEIIKSAE